ncbi:MAG TPA: wax ester/triacylglycerol synthase family O-acyltransferase [Actinomycetota bacterium]|nr:wax ester/triacylglycerol synthase family O-acyltransferase [Actinomycetota bacterium]
MEARSWAEPLVPRDAAFLYLEGQASPYHVAALMVFGGPPPARDEVLEWIGARTGLVPRLRQRLALAPLTGRPFWVDDPHFDLEYHVRFEELPAPGDDRALAALTGELVARHLSRFRPLWEIWVLEPTAAGGFAVLMKSHHSAVDGVAGIRDLTALFAPLPPDAVPLLPPRPVPSELGLSVRSALHAAETPIALLRAARAAAGAPARTLRRVAGTAVGVARVGLTALHPAPHVPLNVLIGPNRSVEFVRASLQDFKDVKAALGGTVNDVVLAVTAGGLRRWMEARDLPIGPDLVALVPISLRGGGSGRGSTGAGNEVTGMLAPLPVGLENPLTRLARVRRATALAKVSGQSAGASALLNSLPLLPAPVTAALAGRLIRGQRSFNVSMPNLRGPEEPLQLAGRQAVDVFALPPLSANAAFILAAMSHAGAMTFGLLADRDAVPDLGVIAEGIEKSIVELVQAAREVG